MTLHPWSTLLAVASFILIVVTITAWRQLRARTNELIALYRQKVPGRTLTDWQVNEIAPAQTSFRLTRALATILTLLTIVAAALNW